MNTWNFPMVKNSHQRFLPEAPTMSSKSIRCNNKLINIYGSIYNSMVYQWWPNLNNLLPPVRTKEKTHEKHVEKKKLERENSDSSFGRTKQMNLIERWIKSNEIIYRRISLSIDSILHIYCFIHVGFANTERVLIHSMGASATTMCTKHCDFQQHEPETISHAIYG